MTRACLPLLLAALAAQSAEQPLTCRVGHGLVFDTLAADGDRVRLSLRFTASAGNAGLEDHAGDSTPRQSVLGSAVYWGFLASSLPLPFDVRYLPLFAIGLGAIIGIPSVVLMGCWSGWRRLAERYPDRNTGRGTSVRSGQLVMNKSVYKMGVRFTMDDSHLHLAMSMPARLGHQPFSVPWADVGAARDEWPWFPFKGEPMARLTFAAHPDVRILVRVGVGRRIAEASGGRLAIAGMREPVAAGS